MNNDLMRIMRMAINNYRTAIPDPNGIIVCWPTINDLEPFDLEIFSKILIQEYELQKREERRNVKSELGYSRIGLNNV